MLIDRTLTNLLTALVQRGRLVLVEGASVEALVAELMAALPDQPAFAQVGPFLSGALIRSPLVDELFAEDRELVELVGEVG